VTGFIVVFLCWNRFSAGDPKELSRMFLQHNGGLTRYMIHPEFHT